jgi:hypothetical protein
MLSAQFSALNEKLSQMEIQQRTLVDLERLSRAETRGENLRVQLRDVQAREAELQARASQLDYELQPTVIERTTAASGSTRPEDVREERRRQLEADRLRTRIDTALEPATPETNTSDAGVQVDVTTQSNETGEGKPR